MRKKQEEILKRQNEELMLKALFTSGKYFDLSECFNILTWVSYTCGLIFMFISNEQIKSICLDLVNISTLIFVYLANKFAKNGAFIRNYFDSYVYDLNQTSYRNEQINTIKSLIYNCCKKREKECQIKIQNSGDDTPNGFRNWYEFIGDSEDGEAIFCCQKQNNLYFNKSIIYDYAFYAVFLLVVIVILCLQINMYGLLNTIRMSYGIIISLSQILFNVFKRYKITLEISGIIPNLDHGHNLDNLEHLQSLICNRRELTVLNVGMLYKYIVKKITREYRLLNKK